MTYREDKDLEFLGDGLQSLDFNDLVQCIVYDSDGKKRHNEQLTDHPLYKAHYPDHVKYWKEIAAEIQLYAGDWFVNRFRNGKGILYAEIVSDVAKHLKVKFNKNASVEEIEHAILNETLKNALAAISDSDAIALAEKLNIHDISTDAKKAILREFSKNGSTLSFLVGMIGANFAWRGMFGASIASVSSIAWLATPITKAALGVFSINYLSGPAYRVTFPAVIQIALLRQKHKRIREGLKVELEELMKP